MNMRYATVSALGVLAATLCCGSALAQQTYQLYQVNEAKYAAPTYADEKIVGFYVDEFYDSNVTRSDEALAEARGLKQADWYTDLGMDARIVQTLGAQRFFVMGDANFRWYARDHALNSAFAHFSGGDSVRLGQCAVTAEGDYYRKRTDDVAFVTQSIENVATTGEVEGAFDCDKKYGLAPSVSVAERWNNNSTALFQEANNRIFTVTGALEFRNGILGSIGAFGEYDNVRYDHAVLDVGDVLYRDRFYDWTIGGRLQKQFDPRLGFMATLSYTTVGSSIPNGPDFHGLTYSLDGTYSPGPHFLLHANLSRAVLPSSSPFATYMVNSQYEADAALVMNRFLRFGLRGVIGDFAYHESTDLAPLIDVRSQRLYTIDGDAAFHVNDHLWLDFYVGEQHGDINVAAYDYWSTHVGLRVRANFGPR